MSQQKIIETIYFLSLLPNFRKGMAYGKKRIWHNNGSLLVLHEWNYHLTIQELEFSTATFLIQAHGLHFAGMTSSNAEKMAALSDKLIQVDIIEEK